MRKMHADNTTLVKERDDAVRQHDLLRATRAQEEEGKVADIVSLQRELKVPPPPPPSTACARALRLPGRRATDGGAGHNYSIGLKHYCIPHRSPI